MRGLPGRHLHHEEVNGLTVHLLNSLAQMPGKSSKLFLVVLSLSVRKYGPYGP